MITPTTAAFVVDNSTVDELPHGADQCLDMALHPDLVDSQVMEIGAQLTPDVAEVRDPVDVVKDVADERSLK